MAEAKDGEKSVTLLPNIADIGHLGDTKLIDMPGYNDERNYVSGIAVSYVLKSTFKIVEECQFVLLIKDICFRSGQKKELIKTLTGFCNMFNI